MTDKEKQELNDRITALETEIVNLRGIMDKDSFSGRDIHRKNMEMRNNVYIQHVKDISLTAIGDTSSSNQASNITDNLNKIINALTNR